MGFLNDLRKLSTTGEYLFRGSRYKNEVLIPKIPKNTSVTALKEKGIYATDVPEIAIFNAILDSKKLPRINGVRKMVYSWYKAEDGWKFGVTRNVKEYSAFSKGYVYVLEKQHFEKLPLEGEFISRKELTPIYSYAVDPDEFVDETKILSLPLSYLTKSSSLSIAELQAMGYCVG